MTTHDPLAAFPDEDGPVALARAELDAATDRLEQAVRDAVAKGESITSVAREANRGRSWVYTAMGRGDEGGEPTNPRLRPTAYLRGAGASADIWSRMEAALWARGVATVRSRTDAWHLARGGTPVALVDFSITDLGDIPAGYMRIGRVRARYVDIDDTRPLGSILSPEASALIAAISPRAIEQSVPHTSRETELRLANGGDMPWGGVGWREIGEAPVFDEHAIARMAADLLAVTL